MLSRLIPYVLCLALSLGALFHVVQQRKSSLLEPLLPTPSMALQMVEPEAFTDADFRREFMESVNSVRLGKGYPALSHDDVIATWLETAGAQITCANLKEVIAKARLPNFREVGATGVSGGSLRKLSARLTEQLTGPDYATEDRIGLVIRHRSGPQHEVIVVTGKALAELSLTQIGKSATDAFGAVCVHCGKHSAFQNQTSGATLVVTCPGCGLCFRLLGRDTKGHYHDATAFLIPSASPTTPPGTHPLDAMISIWQEAVRRCRYVEDGEANGTPTDSWQTPRQTLSRGTGDCEDSALLLTDWMLANKIPARTALGTMNGGGHAWCIVRVEETDYLLESTNRNPDLENLPAVNPHDGYVPTALFDRDALYVRAHPDKPFNSDYWSTKEWIRIPHPKSGAAAQPREPVSRSGRTASAGR